MECFIGTISIFAFNFAPVDWMTCSGQSLDTNQYQALFSLLSTTYGGGNNTFTLPNLQGRFPLSYTSSSVGGQNYTLGQTGGSTSQTLTTANLPPIPNHVHVANATQITPPSTNVAISTATGTSNAPSAQTPFLSASPSSGTGAANIWSAPSTNPTVSLGGVSPISGGPIGVSMQPAGGIPGSSIPISLQNPFLALNFCIAMTGIYPTRE
jgi:microcystin-dependent protein